MPIDVNAAGSFIYGSGRLLEQLSCSALFEAGDAHAVARAVLAYQNRDGGFGHGLEPDKRCPASQPLDVEIALGYLVTVRVDPPAAINRAFDFLATVTSDDGSVPVLLPSIAAYPRAPHWEEADHYPPGLNPTATIAGYGHALGIEHPWIDAATEYAFAALEEPPASGHSLLCATRFLEHAPDPGRAAELAERVKQVLDRSSFFQARPDPRSYGISPLQFAPTQRSFAHSWFTEDLLQENLDHLEAQQQPDGGWPISWEPPSDASRCEWRAMRTLVALSVLSEYGRVSL